MQSYRVEHIVKGDYLHGLQIGEYHYEMPCPTHGIDIPRSLFDNHVTKVIMVVLEERGHFQLVAH